MQKKKYLCNLGFFTLCALQMFWPQLHGSTGMVSQRCGALPSIPRSGDPGHMSPSTCSLFSVIELSPLSLEVRFTVTRSYFGHPFLNLIKMMTECQECAKKSTFFVFFHMSRLHRFDVIAINQSEILKVKRIHVLRWCVQTFDW